MVARYVRVASVASTLDAMELLGLTEVAALVDLSRQRILQLIESDPDFPEPVAELARGRVWDRKDIERWARASGREIQ